MRVNSVNAYRDPAVNSVNRSSFSNDLAQNTINRDSVNKLVNDTESLFTRRERDFFMQMFPDNQSSIERYQLFNRNGKLQDQQVEKGMIFDGLA